MMMIIVYDWEDVKSTNLGSTAHVCILFEQDFFLCSFRLVLEFSNGQPLVNTVSFSLERLVLLFLHLFNGFFCKESSIC